MKSISIFDKLSLELSVIPAKAGILSKNLVVDPG